MEGLRFFVGTVVTRSRDRDPGYLDLSVPRLAGPHTLSAVPPLMPHGDWGVPAVDAQVGVFRMPGNRLRWIPNGSGHLPDEANGDPDRRVLYDPQGNVALVLDGTTSRGELGNGATKEIARKGDATLVDSTTDNPMVLWMAGVDAALLAAGSPNLVVPTPTTVTGKVDGGSATWRCVD